MNFLPASGGFSSLISSTKDLPVFTHPPYIVLLLIVTLLPAILLIDIYTARTPNKRKPPAAQGTKKTQ